MVLLKEGHFWSHSFVERNERFGFGGNASEPTADGNDDSDPYYL